jgi:hypothetical protein
MVMNIKRCTTKKTIVEQALRRNLELDSPSIIRMIKSKRMRLAGRVARMEAKRHAYMILVGKLERKRPIGRHRRRWVDKIKMDLREIG